MKSIYKEIEYDDDIVIVCNAKGEVIYKGMVDYEPLKDEDWEYDALNNVYTLGDMTKKCLAL